MGFQSRLTGLRRSCVLNLQFGVRRPVVTGTDNVLLSNDEVCQSLTELRLRSRPRVELVFSIGYKWCKLWYLKPLSASTVLFCITTNLLTRRRKRMPEKIIYCNLLLCVKSRNSMHTENTNFAKTKHSRMRSARFPSSGEGSAPWMQTPTLDADPSPPRMLTSLPPLVMWPVMHAGKPTSTVDRQTPVKTLPCPKLRLRVVITANKNKRKGFDSEHSEWESGG